MAGSKGSKYYDVKLDYNIKLINKINNNTVINNELFNLLQCLHKENSLTKAAEKLSFSYRKAWNLISNAEKSLSFKLTESKRGGKEGGETLLSIDGNNLLNAYIELKSEFDTSISNITQKFFHKINK
jgi:molybdate transport system regulatory protein